MFALFKKFLNEHIFIIFNELFPEETEKNLGKNSSDRC